MNQVGTQIILGLRWLKQEDVRNVPSLSYIYLSYVYLSYIYSPASEEKLLKH